MQRSIKPLFIFAEGTLYGVFLTLDYLHQPSAWWKYGAIGLCAAACFVLVQREHLMQAALMLTLLADTFLLLLDRHYLLGVICFDIVQSLYAVRLAGGADRKKLLLKWRLPVFLAALLFLWLLGRLDMLTAVSAFSFTQLTISAAAAWRCSRYEKSRAGLLFALGLTLFWSCDACVGLHYVKDYLPGKWLAAACSFGMWLFYLPAQVLIVLSAAKGKEQDD